MFLFLVLVRLTTITLPWFTKPNFFLQVWGQYLFFINFFKDINTFIQLGCIILIKRW